MSEINIFEHAISNVNFADSEDGVLLFIFSTFEVNTNDVKFYVDDQDGKKQLMIHYQSDNVITIPIKNDETYDKIKKSKLIRVFETDTIDGDMVSYYTMTQ